ncbi:MAG: M48 family metallopeptidase [Nitrospirota bacterium]
MKYVPKELRGNVNVSRTSPLKEFAILLGGILGIVIVVYAALGIALDLVVTSLPVSIEQKLGSLYSSVYEDSEVTPAGTALQLMLDRLAAEIPTNKDSVQPPPEYKIHIIANTRENALALPGGNIVIFSALVKGAGSKNELAFVLAHELGHFANRDHLRGLGRRLVLLAASAALFGGDSRVSGFIMNSLLSVEMKFSQHQESAADLWALDLLNRRYGHVAGATDFFKRMSKQENRGRFSYYFATHPFPENRIRTLEKKIEEKEYLLKDKTLLDAVFKN